MTKNSCDTFPPPTHTLSVLNEGRVCENHANDFTPYGTFSDLITDLDIEKKKKNPPPPDRAQHGCTRWRNKKAPI